MPTHRELANALRILSIDAVEKAKSGHPGMPMGMADIAEVLWNDFLKHNPNDPNWLNRDRFVVSNGHGSMLLYALLHLSGYDLSLDELKNFRQWRSKTAGHPEYGITPGVETSTGPLGQGFSNAVGMAIAEAQLAATFNRDDIAPIDHKTFAFLGDGCLMEGISHEAASLAGALKLGKLIAIWDDNRISIDGPTQPWFDDNTAERFEAYGWHVIHPIDGHDHHAIRTALTEAVNTTDRPTLLCCQTTIGFGSPNQAGKASSHGAPLGADEIQKTRAALSWKKEHFVIPETIQKAWDARTHGTAQQTGWNMIWKTYEARYPELAAELQRRIEGRLPQDWSKNSHAFIQTFIQNQTNIATRAASKISLDHLAVLLPELFGGSADLSGSNGTKWTDALPFNAGQLSGRYLHYGVREFAMSAIMTGIALHRGFIPFGGTFLVFSDYARNAIRMAALMKQRTIFVYSHDSIGLGEDGPTHQPIEHIAALRIIPNLDVWRPCDTVETAIAWQQAIEKNGPSCLLLSRQKLSAQDHPSIDDIKKGGYILYQNSETPTVIIIATGSEVELAVHAARESDVAIHVVSMPCMDVFLRQDQDYQRAVLPPQVKKRIAIEAGVADPWYRFIHEGGRILSINQFGKSAPYQQLYRQFGLTIKRLHQTIKELNHDY